MVIGESGGARSVRYFEGGLATTSGRMMMIMGAALCSTAKSPWLEPARLRSQRDERAVPQNSNGISTGMREAQEEFAITVGEARLTIHLDGDSPDRLSICILRAPANL